MGEAKRPVLPLKKVMKVRRTMMIMGRKVDYRQGEKKVGKR